MHLEAEVCVERACQAAHGHQRRSNQYGTDGDLDHKEDVAGAGALAGDAPGSCLNDLIWVDPHHLPYRDSAKEETADQGEEDRDYVHHCIGIDGLVDGITGKGLPCAEGAQQHHAAQQAKGAAGERNHDGLSEESTKNATAA